MFEVRKRNGQPSPRGITPGLGTSSDSAALRTHPAIGVGLMVDVTDVEFGENYQLVLTFEDGARRENNLEDLVQFAGVFRPLLDLAYFRRVLVNPDIGTIVRPNGADLCPDVLYKRGRPVLASGSNT